MIRWVSRILGLTVCCVLVLVNSAQAGVSKKEMAKLQDGLKVAAEKFGNAYVKLDFKAMYGMLDKQYRQNVKFWEYKDYVHYDGIVDGFMKVEVMDVIVVPSKKDKDLFYGKVSQKISSVENVKTKSTGHTDKMEEEFIYWDEWVFRDGVWYKIQKLE